MLPTQRPTAYGTTQQAPFLIPCMSPLSNTSIPCLRTSFPAPHFLSILMPLRAGKSRRPIKHNSLRTYQRHIFLPHICQPSPALHRSFQQSSYLCPYFFNSFRTSPSPASPPVDPSPRRSTRIANRSLPPTTALLAESYRRYRSIHLVVSFTE
jgi:hypothetical protein